MSEPAAPNDTLERLLGSTEPLRRALYPVAVALVALLVGYGVVDGERAALWIGLVVAVLVPGGIEAARRVTFAPATVYAEARAWQAALDDAGARTPDQLAAELLDDEPGEHAAPEPITEQLAVSRLDRCREVEHGRRCRLRPHEATGPGGMPHKFD